jgi:hypothetical protein
MFRLDDSAPAIYNNAISVGRKLSNTRSSQQIALNTYMGCWDKSQGSYSMAWAQDDIFINLHVYYTLSQSSSSSSSICLFSPKNVYPSLQKTSCRECMTTHFSIKIDLYALLVPSRCIVPTILIHGFRYISTQATQHTTLPLHRPMFSFANSSPDSNMRVYRRAMSY